MRTLRIAGIVAGAAVTLVAVLLLLAHWLLDPNDHKGRLESAFHEATGRALRLEGRLSVSVFPWLAVETGRATVANRAGFGDAPFAVVEHARLGVRLWPLLFSRRVEFGPVRVDGLALDLVVRRDGTDNWSDLGEHLQRRRAGSAPGPDAQSPSGLTVARVELREARLRYTDERNARVLSIEDWQLRTGPLGARAAAAIESSLRLVQDGVPLGDLEVRTRVAPATGERLALETTEATLNLLREGRDPAPLEFRTPGVVVIRSNRAVEMSEFELRTGPARLTGSLALEAPARGVTARGRLALAETRPRRLLEALGIDAPATRDPNVLGRLAAASSFEWSAAAGLALAPLELQLDDTRLAGRIEIGKFAPARARFEWRGDAIDLDRYLPPPAAAADPAPAAETEPQASSGPGADATGGAAHARGSIAFDRVTVSGVVLEDVVAQLQIREGRLELEPMQARAFGGRATTRLQYDWDRAIPALRLEQRVEDVDVAALLAQLAGVRTLEGRGRGIFTLTSRGRGGAALLANLAGPYEATVADGAIVGIDLRHEIERAVAVARLKSPESGATGSGRTAFRRFASRGTLGGRVLSAERIEFGAEVASVTGRGRVDYGRNELDLELEARLLDVPAGRVLGLDLGRVKGVPVPLRVTGTLAEPKVRPDVTRVLESAARESVRKPVERKIREELEKLIR